MSRGWMVALWAALVAVGCYRSHERTPAADAGTPARDAGPVDARRTDVGPIEVCNREDDDGDGFVDEDLLRVGSRTLIRPLATHRYNNIPGGYDPERGEVGILLGTFDGERTTLEMGGLDPATGALREPLATLVVGMPGFPLSHVIHDGRHWTMVVSGGVLELYRVDAATFVATRIATLEGGAGVPSVARLGTSGSNIAVAWSTSASTGRLARLSMPASPSEAPTPLAPVLDFTPPEGSFVHYGQVVGTTTGALALFYVTGTGTAPYEIHVAAVTADGAGPFTRHGDFVVGGTVAAHDDRSGSIAAAFSCTIAGECGAGFRTFDPTGAILSPALTLSGPYAPAVLSSGEPGQLAAFSGMFVPTQGELVRIRVADRTVLPERPIPIDGYSGMIGIPEGPGRFIYFEDDGMDLYAFPILCP